MTSLTKNELLDWDSDYAGYTRDGRESSQLPYQRENYWQSGTIRIKKPIQSSAFMQERPINQKELISMQK